MDPPYLVTLLIAVCWWAKWVPRSLADVSAAIHGWRGVLENVFYLQYISGVQPLLGVSWTLCLEIQFYLAFILLLVLGQAGTRFLTRSRMAGGQWVSVGLLLMTGLASLAFWYPSLANLTFFGAWFRFSLGVLTFWVLQGQAPRWTLWSFTLLIALLAVYTRDLRGTVAIATALMIYVCARRQRMERWLSGRIWQFFGRISYSLYLVHFNLGMALMIGCGPWSLIMESAQSPFSSPAGWCVPLMLGQCMC